MTLKEYKEMFQEEEKYKNKKVTFGGETFDSLKEYRRFCELRLLQRAGKIKDIQRQVKFVLIPTQREPDKIGVRGGVKKGRIIEQECAYFADFTYTTDTGDYVVEDTKGVRTKDYIIKRKLMLYIHGIRIQEI